MFRSRVLRARIQHRNLLSQSRIPHARKLQSLRLPQDPSIQRVRFKKPSIFNWKRVASFGIYSSCAAAYIYYLIPEIEIEEEASEGDLEEENEQSANDDEDFDDTEPDEDSIFIPLGFAKRKERSFYRGSDPEWQEFIKLANDHERHKRVQQDLVGLIMTHVNANANFSRSLGGTLKASKVWLDIQFPSGPPPEFERTGIVIADDFIALTKKTSSEMEEQRINRTLWPSAALSSIYASVRVLCRIQWHKAKETLGIQTKPTREDEQLRKGMQAIQRMQEKHLGKPGADMPRPPSDVAKQSPSDPNRVQTPASSTAKSAGPTGHATDHPTAASSLPKLPAGSLPSGTEIPLVLHVFHSTMAKNRVSHTHEPPRGTCILSGLMEVSGNKARATLDVKAAYHPQQARFLVVSAGVRSFKLYRQPPMGGP